MKLLPPVRGKVGMGVQQQVKQQVFGQDLRQKLRWLMTMLMLLTGLYFSTHIAAQPTAVASTPTTETAVFAGGCFWGIQAVFQHTQGVTHAISGYAGGKSEDADYERVSRGGTGHAEAVKISFDPRKVSYEQLLHIFFAIAHDPTQLNRQYPDVGTQYRSAVFYQDDRQKRAAERYLVQLDRAHVFPSKIVTQVTALRGFFPAEKYHQNYATLHPDSPYIARFDAPKVARLKTTMPALYRERPALVAD